MDVWNIFAIMIKDAVSTSAIRKKVEIDFKNWLIKFCEKFALLQIKKLAHSSSLLHGLNTIVENSATLIKKWQQRLFLYFGQFFAEYPLKKITKHLVRKLLKYFSKN